MRSGWLTVRHPRSPGLVGVLGASFLPASLCRFFAFTEAVLSGSGRLVPVTAILRGNGTEMLVDSESRIFSIDGPGRLGFIQPHVASALWLHLRYIHNP